MHLRTIPISGEPILIGPRDKEFILHFVSIIVCTFNRADSLNGALTSLYEQRTLNKLNFEIIVVDDGSIDGTDKVISAHRHKSPVPIRYLRQDHAGVAAARNRGVREAIGNWVAFFDDDQIADKNWLACLIERAMDIDCVGGPCLLRLPAGCNLRLDTTIRRLLGEEPMMMREGNETISGTGNVLINTAVFGKIGLFLESRSYGEDREFFTRAKNAGARFAIAPNAIVYHVIPLSRLTEDYLLRTATNGGTSRAEIDNFPDVIRNSILRVGHLLAINFPRLGYKVLQRDRMGILGRKCSIRFSLAYLSAASKRARVTRLSDFLGRRVAPSHWQPEVRREDPR